MVAQHVHDSNCGKCDCSQFRPLGHGSTHQQAAIGTSGYGESIRVGIASLDEVFTCRNEIVKNILLLQQHTGFVPIFTKFTTPSEVGHGINTIVLQKQ